MDVVNAGYNWNYAAPYCVRHTAEEQIENLLYFFHTPAILTLNGKNHPVDYGNAILIRKGEAHSVTSQTGFFTLDWVAFSADAADLQLFNSISCRFHEIMALQYPVAISNMIMNCAYMIAFPTALNRMTLSSLLTAIMFYIASVKNDCTEFSELRRSHPEIVSLRRTIYENPTQDWTIALMCRKTNLSESSLQKLYKAIFDTSCFQDVIAARMIHAKHLLISTGLSINEIAIQSGFNSYAHFFHSFKKLFGLSPANFRHKYDEYHE